MAKNRQRQRIWRTLRRLDLNEVVTLCRLSALVLALPALQRALSLPRLMKLLDSSGRVRSPRDPIRRLFLVQGLLGRKVGPFRPKCYTQSLLLFHDLRRLGYEAVIRFAISEKEGDLDGHSWIELDGEPFGEERDPRPLFNIIYSYPPEEGS